MAKYFILLIINFFAVLFVLQIELEIIPLIQTNNDKLNLEGLNNAILTISYSFIVSTIFYIVVVSTIENKKKKTNRLAIQSRLNNIYSATTIGSLYLKEKKALCKIKNDDNNSLQITRQKMNFKYDIEKKDNSNTWIPFSTGDVDEISFFSNQAKRIIKVIDEIFAIPNTNTQPDELILALAELRDSWFYASAISLSHHETSIISNFDKGVEKYLEINKIVSKYSSSKIKLRD